MESFPLFWPAGWPRTESYKRQRSLFKTQFGRARDELFRELGLLGVRNNHVNTNIILSTNIPLRRDGLPYAGQANPKDPGVSVFFTLREKNMVFACDKFFKVEDNLWAIVKTIEALRGIKRWGASDMMERAFTGFEALPMPKQKKTWWEVFKMERHSSLQDVKFIYRTMANQHHPDKGGDQERMQEINQAWAEAEKELS